MINDSNYELWLLRYAEGELTDSERLDVERWLATHPEAAEELALYNEAPRLEKDESVHYEAELPQYTVPLWPVALRWSAAAAVVAALMAPVVRLNTEKTSQPTANTVAVVQKGIMAEEENDEIVVVKTVEQKVAPIRIVEPEPMLAEEEKTLLQEEKIENETIEEVPYIDNSVIPTVEYCDNLISYELPPDTIYTNTLVYYDESRRSWTEDLKDWATETKLAQWVGRRIKACENELFALNGE